MIRFIRDLKWRLFCRPFPIEVVDVRRFDPQWIAIDYTPFCEWSTSIVSAAAFMRRDDYRRAIEAGFDSIMRCEVECRCPTCGNVDTVRVGGIIVRGSAECSGDCGGRMYPRSVVNNQRRLRLKRYGD